MSATTQLTDFSDLKQCSRCDASKPRVKFSKRAGYGDGLNAWCKSCQSAYAVEYNKTHVRPKATPEQTRERNYRKNHGIEIEHYNALLLKQGVRCAICHSANPGGNVKNFTVDHDHKTGRIRGLLCRPCNMALGLFKDSTAALLQAAEYLKDAE